MAKDDKSAETGKTAPPYIAFSTLKTLTSNLKAHGVPPRIDKSIMSNFSGAVAGQLMTALRFLNLIDENENPTPSLKKLVATYDTAEWPSALAGVLKTSYPQIFKIDLATASPKLLYDAFGEAYANEGETVRKTVTFFLNAASDAQIPISQYIMKSKKPRSAPTKRRGATKSPRRAATSDNGTYEDFPPPIERKLSEQVLEILDIGNLSMDEEKAVFTVLKLLRKEGK